MKASELITQLSELVSTHGDREVFFPNLRDGGYDDKEWCAAQEADLQITAGQQKDGSHQLFFIR